MISRMSSIYGSITLFLYKNTYTTWSFLESGEVPTDRRTSERRIMQVGSSVSNRYYTQYHNSSSAKKSAGASIFEGSYPSNETVGYQRSTETVDYQEYYKAWMAQGNAGVIEYATGNATVNLMEQTGAVSIAETEDEGDFLGLTMVPEEGKSVTYGMRAMLSDKSTPDNPIVQVVSNLGGKKVIYNVEVNKVNPNNATQLEMFALLSYTDKMGITDGGTFGSHQQLEVYGGNASSIGFCGSLSGADVFLNEKFDWTSIMEKMVQVYKDAGIENQAEDCKALFDFFATYTEQEKEFYRAFIGTLEAFEVKSVSKSEEYHKQPSEVPEEFAGMSFGDLINSGKGNAIPTVNKIVNAKNPEDGKIYLTFFTEDRISCYEPGGEKTWELEISNEEQIGKIKKFFENYMPDRAHVQEYYSDAALGIVSSKEFWLGFFEGASIENTPETTQEPAEGALEEMPIDFIATLLEGGDD